MTRPTSVAVLDACNAWPRGDAGTLAYAGVGRGSTQPSESLIEEVLAGFRAVETGVANEVAHLVQFLNRHHAADSFNTIRLDAVQRIAGTCVTGCEIVDPGPVPATAGTSGFRSRLVARALGSQEIRRA